MNQISEPKVLGIILYRLTFKILLQSVPLSEELSRCSLYTFIQDLLTNGPYLYQKSLKMRFKRISCISEIHSNVHPKSLEIGPNTPNLGLFTRILGIFPLFWGFGGSQRGCM